MAADDLDDARQAMSRGDLLVAYDLATSLLDHDAGNLEARLIAALALARAGIAKQAGEEAAELVARIQSDASAPLWLREDAEALQARLAKDHALCTEGAARQSGLKQAAELYEAVATKYGRSFSCINAATLWLLAGDVERANAFAERARDLVAIERREEPDQFWYSATEAEAALILGDLPGAQEALTRAASLARRDYMVRAVSRRQLRLVCEAKELPAGVLEVLGCPTVLHYCGHRIDPEVGRFPPSEEQRVTREVGDFLGEHAVGFGYGSLASGADIIIAEALLATGAELHIILPFSAEEFEEISVAPAGAEWRHRYRRCLARASSVQCVSDSRYGQDDKHFAHAARIAMGHAINRGRFLSTGVEQLAVWSGQSDGADAGTAHDRGVWTRTGRPGYVIDLPASPAETPEQSRPEPRPASHLAAILFADFQGFSRLHDEQIPAFVGEVLGAIGRVLDKYRDTVLYRNTWGDGIQVVFSDVSAAATCATAFHQAIAAVDHDGLGLPAEFGLRIGLHVGLVSAIEDPVRHQLGMWGREMTRAARIEPRTPEGEVYMTDAVAALLALEPGADFTSDYVGLVTTAKNFETIPMYRLRRTAD
jgi:class 3 adenylate cyclase/tetratricopeptide (TPR) repeat protein